jgi:hypothetical protein
MKKVLVIAACLTFTIGAFAQQKKVYHAAKATMPADKMKMLCKPWVLDTIENFGVYKAATAAERNDGITMMTDSTLFLTMEGNVKTGKWMMGYSWKILNTVTGDNKDKMMFTIMKLSDNYLELEYQTPDLIRTHYYYSAKK